MKKRITSIVALLSFVFVLSIVQASAQHVESVRIAIPFDFQVGNKLLPAGSYRLARVQTFVPSDRSLTLIGLDVNKSIILKASSVDNHNESTTSGMTFLRYGSEYFLSEINYGERKIRLHKPSSDDIMSAQNRAMKPEVITVVFYR